MQHHHPEEFAKIVNDALHSDGMEKAGKILAMPEHYQRVVMAITASEGSILDSGAGRHCHPKTVITDSEDRIKLVSFTGEPMWTEGRGYLPIPMRDANTDQEFKYDITDSDYAGEKAATLLSMGCIIDTS